jgi:hypothetical protein
MAKNTINNISGNASQNMEDCVFAFLHVDFPETIEKYILYPCHVCIYGVIIC